MSNPEPAPPEKRLYFLSVDGEKAGPYRRDELLEAGIEAESLVWFQGCTSWVRAGVIPDLEQLIEEDRKARKKLRKERRKAAKLPEPGSLHWLARIVLLIHVPGGALYLLGTLALIVAFIVWLSTGEDGPRPDGAASRVIAIVGIAGLAMVSLSIFVLLTELVALILFVRRCGRIVAVLSPSEKEGSLFAEMFEGFSFGLPDIPDLLFGDGGIPLPARIVFLGGGLIILVVLLIVMCVFIFFITLIVIGALTVLLFLGVVTIIMVSHIPKVGDGLNRLIEEYKMDIPRVPSRLSYWTGVSAFLLIFGPLSFPAFVLVPIWVLRTASTASQICEQRREAVEGMEM